MHRRWRGPTCNYRQPHCTPDHIKQFLKEAASFSKPTCRVVGMGSGENMTAKEHAFTIEVTAIKRRRSPC